MNTRLNKKVKKDLDAYFKGYRGSEPEVHHALKHILMGALTDANFHAESKRVANMFPKASKAKHAGKKEWEDSLEMNHGVPIAKAAKWDGYEIIDAIAYWASMFIGGPVGAKISSLKEGMNENIRMFVNKFINEVTHSYEYEDMSTMGEDENDKEDFRIRNYHTKYFHVCPSASNLYMDIESKGVDMDMAERSARLHDVLFFVEEHIQRDGYKPEKDYIMVAKNLAKNIMKMAEMMGLEKEHHYIQGHVDIITKTVEGKKLEEKVINLTEKNVPTNPSKWSYYKSQAKKKFDVYPSAYANAWAAKQYKAAGGGWRTTKESIEEGVMSNIHLMIDASKDFEDFKKKFKKDYKKVFKNTPDFMDWLYGMYKDAAPLKAGEKVEEALSVTDERHFGKKGIIIMIDDNGKKVSAIFKNKKNADKYNRNKSSDLQALLKLAKNTPYPKAIDEATRGEIHKAAKKGNYPATIVVSEKGKVIYQELVKTPQLVPAIFMILQKKYPNAKISVESKSGETLFTEAKSMDMKKRLKVYDKLKKGDKITIKYGSSMRSGREQEFVVSKGKTKVGKAQVERITLKNPANPKGVKYYLYQRNGNVTMAIGDMAATIEDMHESVNEGKKRYNVMHGVGKSKYVVNYHDGKKKHKDGSDFFDMSIFKNKKDLAKKVNDLQKGGYEYGFAKSVNEGKYKVGDTITVIRKDGMKYKGKVEKLNPLKLRTDSTSTVVLPNPMIKKVVKESVINELTIGKMAKRYKNRDKFISAFFKHMKKHYGDSFKDFEKDKKYRETIGKAWDREHGVKESVNEYFVENYDDTKQLSEYLKENSVITEAEYQGRDVKLNKIMQGDVKKFKVYVKNPKGNVVKVNFGHKGKGGEKTMSIKKNNPERRKSFRARHNCDNPGPKHKARYWSCRKW